MRKGKFTEIPAIKLPRPTLAGVAQWVECWPANQRVTSLILSQDTRLGCRPGPQLGVLEREPHIDISQRHGNKGETDSNQRGRGRGMVGERRGRVFKEHV